MLFPTARNADCIWLVPSPSHLVLQHRPTSPPTIIFIESPGPRDNAQVAVEITASGMNIRAYFFENLKPEAGRVAAVTMTLQAGEVYIC